MSQPNPPGAAGRPAKSEDQSTADLLKGIVDDAQSLLKQEVLLAKQEITEGLTVAAKGSVLLIVAGVLGLYALGFLFTTAAWGLEALGLPKSASFGIVTLVLLIIVGILALLGQRRLKATKVKPERAQAELKVATAELAAEARIAAEGVKADFSGQARAAKDGMSAAPGKAKASAGSTARTVADEAKAAAEKAKATASSAAGDVKDAAGKAKDQIAAKVKRDG
jgi:hypothetical protein